VTLREPAVHPQEIGGEERGFVATRAGAQLDDHVALIEGIGRYQELVELRFELLNLGLEPIDVGSGELLEPRVGVAREFPGLGQVTGELLETGGGLANTIEPRMLAAERLQLLRIPCGRRIGELPLYVGRAGERGFEPRFQA